MTRQPPYRAALLATLSVLVVVASCDKDSPTAPTDCTLTLSPTSVSSPAAGSTGTIVISVASGCSWQAQSSASWLTLTSAASGSGAASITYSISPNESETPRSASIAIEDRAVAVAQAGREPEPPICTFDVSPESAAFTKDGGEGTVIVTSTPGCLWTATSADSWVIITAGAAGSGNGSVTYQVSETREPPSRSSTLAIAGHVITITQEGDAGACVYSVDPVDLRLCMPRSVLTTRIETQEACTWTLQTDASWIGLSATSGAGAATISMTIGDNYDAPRNGVVMVRWPTPTAGQNVRVAQAGCRYAVTQSVFAAPVSQSSFSFMVMQQSDPTECGGALQDRCVWSAVADVPWIDIRTSMPRMGDERVDFLVLANGTGAARTGTIRIRDLVVRVNQAGQ
jgi:hypothetical protein